MPDPRTLLAGGLGVALGLLFVLSPGTVVRIQTAGRLPHDRGGNYGESSVPSGRVLWAVRGLGVGLLVAGLYFGATALSGV